MMLLAYDKTAVRNLQLQNAAATMQEEGQLTPPQYQAALGAFPVLFKIVNPIMRIGLFIFTSLCILFAISLMGWLIGFSFNEQILGGLMIICAIGLSILSAFLIKSNKWYRHGSDNALCYAALICFCTGIVTGAKMNDIVAIGALFTLLCAFFAWRYGDPVLAFGTYGSLVWTISVFVGEAHASVLSAAFSIATISFATYIFSKNSLNNGDLFYWEDCFKVLEIASLVGIYGALNYYMVDSFHAQTNYITVESDIPTPTPLAWFFTITTTLIPLSYLYFGITKRDRILWILGSLGTVASILTYRYYNAIMPLEWALTLGGLAALGLAFFLIRYYKTPKKGISYEPNRSKGNIIETLVVNQLLQTDTPKNSDTKFGGGDFGGGGASAEY
jgi:hypothetical protein